jgi:GT2 family glycosyltransferase
VRSILAQQGASVECIVIEQSNVALARHAMPPGTRYLHLPHPQGDPGWRKSWAYNVAAKQARAKVLVCHDGDILVPTGYAQAVLETLDRGFDNAFIQRFLFYLNRADSQRVQETNQLSGCCPDDVRHNWVGGTLAIRRDAYFAIGGFDERFVDWGGEDNEFHSRCAALRQCRFGFVPFVHLWHPPQANKSGAGREAAVELMNKRLAIAPAERIKELREKLASGGANRTCAVSSG